MNRKFKFRYANEIAGVFVIGAVALLITGIVFAGRSQGWFEPRFELKLVFETDEGTFGLQEGAAVLVRKTAAGRVGPIMPTPDGQMGTTLEIKESFRPFITKDAVAKVKRKFGVAGDAYVEIERGTGDIVEDGDTIEPEQDEEILETVQRMLAEVQEIAMPIFEQVETIIANVDSILAKIERGEGAAGTIIGNAGMRDDLLALINRLEKIGGNMESLTGHAGGLLSNEIARVAVNLEHISSQAAGLMDREVPTLATGTRHVQDEAVRTLEESRRLIEGFQRHWLVRKYIEPADEQPTLAPTALGWQRTARRGAELQDALMAARAADNPQAVVRSAYHMAVYVLDQGDLDTAAALHAEGSFAARKTNGSHPELLLLEAELRRRTGDLATAEARLESVLDAPDSSRRQQAEAGILLASVHADAGRVAEARQAWRQARRVSRREEDSLALAVAFSGLEGRLAFLEGRQEAAAVAYAEQAGHLRAAEAYPEMVTALRRAGDLYANLNAPGPAAECYLRAASSLAAQAEHETALQALALAREQALLSKEPLLEAQADAIAQRLATPPDLQP